MVGDRPTRTGGLTEGQWPRRGPATLRQDGKELQVVNFLLCGHTLEYEVVEVNDPNESGLMPLDVSTPLQKGARDREITEILAQARAKHRGGRSNSPTSRPISKDDDDIDGGNGHQSHGEAVLNASPSSKLDGDGWIYETLLVFSGLIANATYQSVLQPPTVIARDKADNNSGESKGLSAPAPSPGTEEKITYGAGLVYILFLGGNTFGFLVSV
ncbi:hypothetical protein EUGRSUZ_E01644 [Eucalyptus grandis]|uniref:Uncharacterized protein n=2 Tax=Eucalyptus grandis TaxID=71139 RepID=A0A059C5G8_EUCGR|nr:hypothetical protein EUGRSUZ_E01644 [Eucalyptus grandis]